MDTDRNVRQYYRQIGHDDNGYILFFQKLRLRTPNAGMVLDMESKLEQLLTDKMIYNGSTLELCYIDSFLTS